MPEVFARVSYLSLWMYFFVCICFLPCVAERSLPENLGRLRSLKELVANGNRLQHLPESFGTLVFMALWL